MGIRPGVDLATPQQAFSEFNRGAHVIWNSAKLLALTIDTEKGYGGRAQPFGRGWARARMWDQYAEQHRGVCLVFDRAKLRTNLIHSLLSQDLAKPYYKAVRYTAGGPAERLLELDMARLADGEEGSDVRSFVEAHNDDLFFLKAKDWETEHEYRFVVTAPDVDYVHADYGDALTAVILGERFPVWQEAGANSLCHEVGAIAAKMNWRSGAPRPEELPVDL